MTRGGPSGNLKLSALWILDEAQAKRIVLRALSMYKGNVAKTARELKVSRSTLKRWIGQYKLSSGLNQARRVQ